MIRKGIGYYNWQEARLIRDQLIKGGYPEARVVSYQLGYGVQYRVSGPYHPELEKRASA